MSGALQGRKAALAPQRRPRCGRGRPAAPSSWPVPSSQTARTGGHQARAAQAGPDSRVPPTTGRLVPIRRAANPERRSAAEIRVPKLGEGRAPGPWGSAERPQVGGSRFLFLQARPRPPPPARGRPSNRRKVEERPGRHWPPSAPPLGPASCERRRRGRAVAGATRSVWGHQASPRAAMARPRPSGPQQARCGSPSLPERPLQVKVVGLFSCPNFQIAKSAAEELKNETWEYSSSVMSFVNGQFLGDALGLQKWAHEVWDIVDIKPSALYDALTEDFSTKFLRDTKHDFVFLDICIDSSPIGRLIFELYCDVCPKTCKNFQVLCTGKAGFSQRGIRLHYKDSIFHRIVRNGWIQGGDIVYGKGDNGESIYGPTFEGN
ncbi:problable inactive peptidyl-prolyl cis-trans isomerase-like 6 isoform X3 [Theropithecus gelada]|uniref:problable inactive peptidyl-prolyl cis-trans isomerase-like 6 isoform X3 n=1 Tax=Theropithecus gelada TaxID=9565 RepID=UPI000DC1BB19|nr:problable inactive peptidyl-prolyl cis-trans isomerase-like 6 isoform X3 [Theropithecus gelada]